MTRTGQQSGKRGWGSALIGVVFLIGLMVAGEVGVLPWSVVLGYGGGSAISVLLFGYDKTLACAQCRRVPERVLHLCNLLGGWPGGALGQALFYHKIRQPGFRRRYWGTVLLNCVGLGLGLRWLGH